MKLKSAKITAGAALVLQIGAMIITLYIFINQQAVKEILSSAPMVFEVHSLPMAYFLINTVPAFIYFIFIILFVMVPDRIGTAAVPFLVVLCFFKIVLSFLTILESFFIARRGVEETASISLLNSAISQSTGFLATIAFALFCFSAGICYGAGKKEDSL